MSDRDVVLPDRGLLNTLRGFQNRLIAAQRRARFPGAVRMKEASGSVTVPATPTWVDLVAVNVDRGRWLITGGHYATSLGSGGDVPYLVMSQFYYGATFSPVYQVGQPNPGTVTPAVDCTEFTWTVDLAAPATVVMRSRRSTNLASCSTQGIYLIASPA